MKTQQTENGKLFLVMYLGVLSAFAPFVMDTYLASMPQLAAYFSASASEAQMSLASCVAGLAVGQLFLGSISDSLGRKAPILVSLAVYAAVTAGCIFSPCMGWFIALRFVQGVAASGGVVLTRSIVADCYRGDRLTRMYGVVGTINGVATVMAPVLGGVLAVLWGWKGVFWALLAIGAAMLACTVAFRETLPLHRRIAVSPSAMYASMRSLLADKRFLMPCIGFAMFMSLIIVNLSSAPFIFKSMGLDEGGISLLLGINSISLGIAALLSSRAPSQKRVMWFSAITIMAGAAITSMALWHGASLWIYETGLLSTYLGLGALNTATVALAMEAGRHQAGAASALLGAVGYLAGGVVTALEGMAEPHVSTPILLMLLAAATLALSFPGKPAASAPISQQSNTDLMKHGEN